MKRLFLGIALLSATLLCGGCMEDDEYTQGVWRRMSDFDGVARSGASSFTIGNKGYICCGYRGSNKDYLKDLWMYDIDGNYWTQCADMPAEAVGRHKAAAFALDGKGYVTTGAQRDEPDFLADTWEYDPEADAWTRKDDFAGGIRRGALGFAIGGYGYTSTASTPTRPGAANGPLSTASPATSAREARPLSSTTWPTSAWARTTAA